MSSRVWQEKLFLASKTLVRPQTYTQGGRKTIESNIHRVHRERYNITVPDTTVTLTSIVMTDMQSPQIKNKEVVLLT